jgi:hydroxymethylglutaryl-CoA reductase
MKTKDKMIAGFSKFSKPEKLAWLAKHFFTSNPMEVAREFASFWHTNVEAQRLFDGISENTITNFYMPYGVAPNFIINHNIYCVPMVIEESSVVAAASSGAKFWYTRGGFNAEVVSMTKLGHVHFIWHGDPVKMYGFINYLRPYLLQTVKPITANMDERGGGITNIELLYMPEVEKGYYQLKVSFNTCNAMGANFINSVLETFAQVMVQEAETYADFDRNEQDIQVIMAILSNYTPDCLVRSWVECDIAQLDGVGELAAYEFAEKFVCAVRIAENDPYRAATHNKGIYNGIDSVVIATGNDFRAIEACGHAYAARKGKYASLSHAEIIGNKFRFELEVPLAVGTIGGLTKIHPLAKRSLELLDNPSAETLMHIMASVGLAQNFAAVRSLVTTGIQKGHMKMHLNNILSHFEANEQERENALCYFSDKIVSFASVRSFLDELRNFPSAQLPVLT